MKAKIIELVECGLANKDVKSIEIIKGDNKKYSVAFNYINGERLFLPIGLTKDKEK